MEGVQKKLCLFLANSARNDDFFHFCAFYPPPPTGVGGGGKNILQKNQKFLFLYNSSKTIIRKFIGAKNNLSLF